MFKFTLSYRCQVIYTSKGYKNRNAAMMAGACMILKVQDSCLAAGLGSRTIGLDWETV